MAHLPHLASVLTTLLLASVVPAHADDEPPAPLALLKGVEAARMKHDRLRARLNLVCLEPPPRQILSCLAEMDGEKQRFEVFPGENVAGEVIQTDGRKLRLLHRGEYNDVCIFPPKDPMGWIRCRSFDPRVLGLTDLPDHNSTVKGCLWTTVPVVKLVGQEDIRGDKVWRVRAERGQYSREYWIEVPSYRVHRITFDSPAVKMEVNSEFDATVPSPFPKRVDETRETVGQITTHRVYEVFEFALGVEIPNERFELLALDIPKGTAVVDYEKRVRLGYWNGKELVDHPVKP